LFITTPPFNQPPHSSSSSSEAYEPTKSALSSLTTLLHPYKYNPKISGNKEIHKTKGESESWEDIQSSVVADPVSFEHLLPIE
jgi:hypothetical protein